MCTAPSSEALSNTARCLFSSCFPAAHSLKSDWHLASVLPPGSQSHQTSTGTSKYTHARWPRGVPNVSDLDGRMQNRRKQLGVRELFGPASIGLCHCDGAAVTETALHLVPPLPLSTRRGAGIVLAWSGCAADWHKEVVLIYAHTPGVEAAQLCWRTSQLCVAIQRHLRVTWSLWSHLLE